MLSTDQMYGAAACIAAGAAAVGWLAGRWHAFLTIDPQLDRVWQDGYDQAATDLVRHASEAQPAPGGELLPELPDWDDDTLASLRDDTPGETTGPFTITDLPAPAATSVDPRYDRGGEHHQGKRFADLPLPTPAELEQEWSWGKVAHQIVQARVWLDSSAWDIPTEVAA